MIYHIYAIQDNLTKEIIALSPYLNDEVIKRELSMVLNSGKQSIFTNREKFYDVYCISDLDLDPLAVCNIKTRFVFHLEELLDKRVSGGENG